MKNCTQPTEMGQLAIVWVKTEPAFRIPLPIPVIGVLQSEIYWSERQPDPVDLLARSYPEWETQTGPNGKDAGNRRLTCFRDSYRSPFMLYWTLAHFSDATFSLTEPQKQVLAFHTLEVSTLARRFHVSRLMSTVTADALDYCWYLLRKRQAN